MSLFDVPVQPDHIALLETLRREKTPERVHFMELYIDAEMQQEIVDRFGLSKGLTDNDRWYAQKLKIRLERFLGHDCVMTGFGHRAPAGDDSNGTSRTVQILTASIFRLPTISTEDTAGPQHGHGKRVWADEHRGAITSWQEFEKYQWPNPDDYEPIDLDWYSENLPDDMCLMSGCHTIFEHVTNLMSTEGFCFALYEQPDLVDAVVERVGGIFHRLAQRLMAYDRVKLLFGGDDMGFRTGTLVNPQVLIDKILPWHKKNAALAHAHGKLYLLHSCGKLNALMPALIDDVGIDGRHSFEDIIEPVTVAKERYGDRIALIGGIDVDLLTRATPEDVRERVRDVLELCHPGGGYCLGSGNTITN